MLGYMAYVNEQGYLKACAEKLGGIELVLAKPSLIKKLVNSFNAHQEILQKLGGNKNTNLCPLIKYQEAKERLKKLENQ